MTWKMGDEGEGRGGVVIYYMLIENKLWMHISDIINDVTILIELNLRYPTFQNNSVQGYQKTCSQVSESTLI